MPVAHDTILTRYMRFASFASTLAHGLFIPKATLFDDKLEGVLHYFNTDQATAGMTREEIRRCLEWVYVSCWYSRSPESHAMWRLYGGRHDEAIAIQTSATQLRIASSVLNRMHSSFDAVRYEEPEPHIGTRIGPGIERLWDGQTPGRTIYASLFAFVKHVGYEFEQEVRLVSVDSDAQPEHENPRHGVRLDPAETREMIRNIIVGPRAPDWLLELTRDLATQYGVEHAVVRRSSLDEEEKGSA